ncbi:MAG: hypothetical protein K2M91_10050 [Lachnospiraceae bacterium]|nr:hypothetical protein [Lachnospiraceae bacterium]
MRIKAAVVFIMISLVCICALDNVRGSDESTGVTFPVLSDMILDVNNPEFILKNPSVNKERYILKYEFTNTTTGDVFFSTNWLEGGKQYHYTLDDIDSTMGVNVHIYAKDADTYKDVNGVNISIKIGVRESET